MAEVSEHHVATAAEVAPGVYRFGTQRVNWYVVEDDGALLVVDAGLPGHWQQLLDGLDELGYRLDDVSAVALTHGHADHVGFAEQLRSSGEIPVLVHGADADLVGGVGDASAGEVVWNLWRPAVIALLLELARNGGLSIPPVTTVETFEDDATLDLPGAPRVIHVPGHSAGSCALYLEDREALLCGDALATLDLKTGRARGPQLMSMFNDDEDRAVASLDRVESLGAVTLLPGHGEPWRGSMHEAVRMASER